MTDKQLSILKSYTDDEKNRYLVCYDGEVEWDFYKTMDKDKVEVFKKIDAWEPEV